MILASPLYLLWLLVLPALWFWQKKKQKKLTIKYPDVEALEKLESKAITRLIKLGKILRYSILILLILAVARPQSVNFRQERSNPGVDIMVVLDVSLSMNAEDFKPQNRLMVAKKTTAEFIKARKNDRLGLVIFGGDAYTQCPLTIDHNILFLQLEKIEAGMAGDGTAIGLAMAMALNRMKESHIKSKIMILLTDGVNNRGEIDPMSAADLAKDLGIKIYTIGVGKKEGAPIPIYDPVYGKLYARNPDGSLVLTKIDEELLENIAAQTNGLYFRAEDEQGLKEIYSQIDNLEKSEIKTKQYVRYNDYFPIILWLALILLGAEILLFRFVLRIRP
jgi:Ca-activated chloride channel homolog